MKNMNNAPYWLFSNSEYLKLHDLVRRFQVRGLDLLGLCNTLGCAMQRNTLSEHLNVAAANPNEAIVDVQVTI